MKKKLHACRPETKIAATAGSLIHSQPGAIDIAGERWLDKQDVLLLM